MIPLNKDKPYSLVEFTSSEDLIKFTNDAFEQGYLLISVTTSPYNEFHAIYFNTAFGNFYQAPGYLHEMPPYPSFDKWQAPEPVMC